ncbi:hypothetical protein LHJ74_03560 [Streptomyces sp. N2-109]|uniref:Uncharacterized protein n=1 Tax=Streptomyces gossypii TaxID=2883101 RepID=A0ABT2JMB9_9ACTN|nr:hypothetical protein [Streptomyces gossypii]MCT2589020.1 hypothetical protein [Streptomyces gossypii]
MRSYDRTTAPAPGLRLLPWEDGTGKPCFLSSDGPGGTLWQLADEIEADQLRDGACVLTGARAVLEDHKAGEYALRHALRATTHSLRAVLRVADSRGARLPGPDHDHNHDHGDDDHDGQWPPAGAVR